MFHSSGINNKVNVSNRNVNRYELPIKTILVLSKTFLTLSWRTFIYMITVSVMKELKRISRLLLSEKHSLREKCPNTELVLVRIFVFISYFQIFWSAFGLNTGKYGPELTPYLGTFHAVIESLAIELLKVKGNLASNILYDIFQSLAIELLKVKGNLASNILYDIFQTEKISTNLV